MFPACDTVGGVPVENNNNLLEELTLKNRRQHVFYREGKGWGGAVTGGRVLLRGRREHFSDGAGEVGEGDVRSGPAALR